MQVDEDKEARKLEAARAVLAGRSFTEGEEDPFEGLGPQEIQAYIDKALAGVSHSDPFEVSLNFLPGSCMSTSQAVSICPSSILLTSNHAASNINLLAATHAVKTRIGCDVTAAQLKQHVCMIRHAAVQLLMTENDCLAIQGMTPEEINEYTEKNGVPTQYQ